MYATPYEADFECPKGHTFTARAGPFSSSDAVTCPQCYQEWIEANVPAQPAVTVEQAARLREIDEKITQEELREVFGERIPMPFVKILISGCFKTPLVARKAVNQALAGETKPTPTIGRRSHGRRSQEGGGVSKLPESLEVVLTELRLRIYKAARAKDVTEINRLSDLAESLVAELGRRSQEAE